MDLTAFAEQVIQKKLNVHHALVYQHDEEAAHFDFAPAKRRDNIHSGSKSVLSMAIGIAIEEGILTLDSRPAEVLAKHRPEGGIDSAWSKVTLRHLLTMSSGHTVKLLNA